MRPGKEMQKLFVQGVQEETEILLGVLLESALNNQQGNLRRPRQTHPHRIKSLILLHRIIHILRHKRVPPG